MRSGAASGWDWTGEKDVEGKEKGKGAPGYINLLGLDVFLCIGKSNPVSFFLSGVEWILA